MTRPRAPHAAPGGEGPLLEVRVGELSLERFDELLAAVEFTKLGGGVERAHHVLQQRTVWNVNSTARGGGVAELLVSLLALARGAGVDARWLVIRGDPQFFTITKRIHNRLYGFAGDGGPLADAERRHYERTLAPNGKALQQRVGDADAVILHDPQTAGLIPVLRAMGVPVVWRCHVGVDTPNELALEAQRFLEPYVAQADAMVFSRAAFAWGCLDGSRRTIIAPSIDAFHPKNQELDHGTAAAILDVARLRLSRDTLAPATFTRMDGTQAVVQRPARVIEKAPLRHDDQYVLQVSRWDALKDPLGVIAGFAQHIAPASEAHLVYAGPAVESVADDPEGATVLAGAHAAWLDLPPAVRRRVHLAMLPMDDLEENAAIVNALQRGARVVIQKSLAEGFGLTVAEAMWKARAVTASRIGGIQDQIEDGRSGVLLHDPRDLAAFGAAVNGLLADEETSHAMGTAARERVRENFLGPHSLLAFLDVLAQVLHAA